MQLSNFCIKNPLIVLVAVLITLFAGVYFYLVLPITLLPEFSTTQVEIDTNYSGGSPQFMEQAITTPIEVAIRNIPGIDAIRSLSSTGESHIHVTFKENANIEEVISQIQVLLSTIRGKLPQNATTPALVRNNFGGSSMVLYLGVYSPTLKPLQISKIAYHSVQRKLQGLSTVGRVVMQGYSSPAVRVDLKPSAMARYDLTPSEIESKLNAQNGYSSGGMLENSKQALMVNISSKPGTLQQLRKVVVKYEPDGESIKLADIADVNIMPENLEDSAFINGHPGVVLQVFPVKNESTIDVAKQVETELAKIRTRLPTDIEIVDLLDMSQYIQSSISEIRQAIIWSIFLVSVVTFVFIGSFRLFLIPIVTIPVCTIGIFIFLHCMGYSINLMTLLAIVLSIGLVVDDAIVVLENCSQHFSASGDISTAIQNSMREITFPIIAMTETLVIVFVPIFLIQGVVGELIRPFAFTLVVLVVFSGVLSLTVTPVMCSSMLKKHHRMNASTQLFARFMIRMTSYYESSLQFVLGKRHYFIVLLVLFTFSGAWVASKIQTRMFPAADFGGVVGEVIPHANDSPQRLQSYIKQVEAAMEKHPAMLNYFGRTDFTDQGVNFYAQLKPASERQQSAAQIASQLESQFDGNLGSVAFFDAAAIFGGASSDKNITMVISCMGDYRVLNTITRKLADAIKRYPGVSNINTDLSITTKEVDLTVNKPVANDFSIAPASISSAISLLYGGKELDEKYYDNGMLYPIILSLPPSKRGDLSELQNIFINDVFDNNKVQLSRLVSSAIVSAPHTLTHYNGLEATRLRAELAPGYEMSDVISKLETIANEVLPNNAFFTWTDSSKQYLESTSSMLWIILFAIAAISCVLTIQFKSARHVLIILTTVPLAFVGATMALKLVGGTFNIYSKVALLVLLGLVTKHGILITHFANKYLLQGMDVHKAVVQAATRRLRPVLMTVFAMILGSVPLVFTHTKGASDLSQIAWVIIGGLLFGTALSMYAVPMMYTLIVRKQEVNNAQSN